MENKDLRVSFNSFEEMLVVAVPEKNVVFCSRDNKRSARFYEKDTLRLICNLPHSRFRDVPEYIVEDWINNCKLDINSKDSVLEYVENFYNLNRAKAY